MSASAPPIFALTTDFGTGSVYVAQMKGVLLSAVPEAQIVDVTHDVPHFCPRGGALVMRSAAFSFPLGTVHVVVVDPGVGTERQGLAVRLRGMTFVGPDNGVLSDLALDAQAEVVVLDQPAFMRHPVAPTFHGRDVFSPVAAALASGVPLAEVGSSPSALHPSILPLPTLGPTELRGVTVMADRFGNLMTNIPAPQSGAGAPERWEVLVAGQAVPYGRTYEDVARGALLALPGSDGYLEVAVCQGSAADVLGSPQDTDVLCQRVMP